MNEQVRHKLSEIIQRYGRDLCGQPKRCKGLLLDHCADDRREVFVLVSALEEQVVGDLLPGLGGQAWSLVSSRLVRRLVEHRAMAEDAALWAVESWALALGVISEVQLVAPRTAPRSRGTIPAPVTAAEYDESVAYDGKISAELFFAQGPARQGRVTEPRPATTMSQSPGNPKRADSEPLQPGAPEIITSRVGQIRLRLIPPGEFWMGSKSTDPEVYDDETPRHQVQISQAFYLGTTPVTQAQYEAVIGKNPSHFQEMPDNPVEGVSWFEAVTFCNELSRLVSLAPYYRIRSSRRVLIGGGSGYRLPTEAEWEYACRAGSETRYYCGDSEVRLGDYARYLANSQGQAGPVGCKHPNVFGLYDMHGQVWEWCWDAYHSSYYRQSPSVDPLGAEGTSTECRVIRGGCCNDKAPEIRAAIRYKFPPDVRFEFLGFRAARGLPGR